MCLGGVQTEEQKVAKIRSKVIDQAFQTDQKQDESIKKLLLLGAGKLPILFGRLRRFFPIF